MYNTINAVVTKYRTFRLTHFHQLISLFLQLIAEGVLDNFHPPIKKKKSVKAVGQSSATLPIQEV